MRHWTWVYSGKKDLPNEIGLAKVSTSRKRDEERKLW